MKDLKRICPKCSREIDYLVSDSASTFVQYLSLDIQGDVQYENKDFDFNYSEDSTYYCPECGKILFNEEEKAIAFLKGDLK